MRTRLVTFAAISVLIAACGATTAATRPPGDQAPAAITTSAAAASPTAGRNNDPNEVPDAVVRDVKTGEDVNLRALIPAERPILFWFWAPH